MIKALWQRFTSRNRRIMSEVVLIQHEMAEQNPRLAAKIFPNTTSRATTVLVFWVLLLSVGAILWLTLRSR
jgi:hypothetical protein